MGTLAQVVLHSLDLALHGSPQKSELCHVNAAPEPGKRVSHQHSCDARNRNQPIALQQRRAGKSRPPGGSGVSVTPEGFKGSAVLQLLPQLR